MKNPKCIKIKLEINTKMSLKYPDEYLDIFQVLMKI